MKRSNEQEEFEKLEKLEDLPPKNEDIPGVYKFEHIQYICDLYEIHINVEPNVSWLPYDIPSEKMLDNKRIFRPMLPNRHDIVVSCPSGTYGFIIPVVTCVDEEANLWTMCAMKTSLTIAPAMQELTKTIAYSKNMEQNQSYPGMNIIDGFSILNPNTCEHCLQKKKIDERDTPISLDAFLQPLCLVGSPPPSTWWLFWFSMIKYASSPSRISIIKNSYFNAKLTEEVQNSEWGNVSAELTSEGVWISKNEELRTSILPDVNSFVVFTIPYVSFRAVKTIKSTSNKKWVLSLPKHVNSPKLEELLWNDLETRFALNNLDTRSSSSSLSSRQTQYGGYTKLAVEQVTYVIVPSCMVQCYMFTELGDELLTQVSNVNDGFKKFSHMHIKNNVSPDFDLNSPQTCNFVSRARDTSTVQKKNTLRDLYLSFLPPEYRTIKEVPDCTVTTRKAKGIDLNGSGSNSRNELNFNSSPFRLSSTSSSKSSFLKFFKKKKFDNDNYKISYLIMIDSESLHRLLSNKDYSYHHRKGVSLMAFWDILKLKCIEDFSKAASGAYKTQQNNFNLTTKTRSTLEQDVEQFIFKGILKRFNYSSLKQCMSVQKMNKNVKCFVLYFSLADMCFWYPENVFIRHVDFRNEGSIGLEIASSSSLNSSGSASSTLQSSTKNSPNFVTQSSLRPPSNGHPSLLRYSNSQNMGFNPFYNLVKMGRNILLRILIWSHIQAVRSFHSQRIVHGDIHMPNIISFSAASVFRTTYSKYSNNDDHVTFSCSFKRNYIVPVGGCDENCVQITSNNLESYIQQITVDVNIFPEIVLIDFATADICTTDFSKKPEPVSENKAPSISKWVFPINQKLYILPRAINYGLERMTEITGLNRHQDSDVLITSAVDEIFGRYVKRPITASLCRSSEQSSIIKMDSKSVYKQQIITNMTDVFSLGMILHSLICGFLPRDGPEKWCLSRNPHKNLINIEPTNFNELKNQFNQTQLCFIPNYGVSIVQTKLLTVGDDLRQPASKVNVVYEIQNGYLGSDWITLHIDHETVDNTLRDVENGFVYMSNMYRPAKIKLTCMKSKVDAITKTIMEKCSLKNDVWLYIDFFQRSNDSSSSLYFEEHKKHAENIASNLLIEIDANGLPLYLHDLLITTLETAYTSVQNTHTLILDEHKNKANINSLNGPFYKFPSRNDTKSYSKQELVSTYNNAMLQIDEIAHKLSQFDICSLDPAFNHVVLLIAQDAKKHLKIECENRFSKDDLRFRSSSVLQKPTDFGTLLNQLRKRGWCKENLRSTLYSQYGFCDSEADQMSELISSCLANNPGERPSTLEMSHASMFNSLRNYLNRANAKSSDVSTQHTCEHEDLDQIIDRAMNLKLRSDFYSSDYISQKCVDNFKKSMVQIHKSRFLGVPPSNMEKTDIYCSIESSYSRRFVWFLPQAQMHSHKTSLCIENPILYSIEQNTETMDFKSYFPKLTKNQISNFYKWNILSGRLSIYSLGALYQTYRSQCVDLVVHFETSLHGVDEMVVFFCENLTPDEKNREEKDTKRRSKYLEKLFLRLHDIYNLEADGASIEQMLLNCQRDFPWLLLMKDDDV